MVEQLGDAQAILVLDETGVVKQGTHSAEVAKPYVGCVGTVENAQVGVFLAYASPQGVAFLDRALYLPEEWTDDPARCQQAGIPEGVAFATKPQLAQALLERARAQRRCRRLGDGRQRLRRRPAPADVVGGAGPGLCPGRLGQGVRQRGGDLDPTTGQHPAHGTQGAAGRRVAAALGGRRGEGAALV